MFEIIFSQLAEKDLREIVIYYRSIDGDVSRKIFDAIKKKTVKLAEFPERGRVVPELMKQNINDYRELIEGNYRIIYSVNGKRVIIHTIVDSRRNLEDVLLRKLMRRYDM